MSIFPLLRRLKLLVIAGTVLLIVFWVSGPYLPSRHWEASLTRREDKIIALTFDDGPHPVYTPKILEILDEYQVRATFFMVGTNVAKHPEVAREVLSRGHELANHSHKHTRRLSHSLPPQIKKDCRETQRAIHDATGVTPRFYRAPHGRISPWMGMTLQREGFTVIGWNASPRDWRVRDPEELVQSVLRAVRPGSVILFHDALDLDEAADREVLVQALPPILQELRARGYEFATIGELLGEDPYL